MARVLNSSEVVFSALLSDQFMLDLDFPEVFDAVFDGGGSTADAGGNISASADFVSLPLRGSAVKVRRV